jgi:hypothetical protein
MTLELGTFDVMEHLWETLEKSPDGQSIRYSIVDIEQLWVMGFVDTGRVGFAKWKSIFDPYQQANGSFLLGKDDFFSLDAYRYKGEIKIPFDAMRINEGKYTDEGFDELMNMSIAPSCDLPKSDLNDFFAALKKDYREDDGLIAIRKTAKERIKALLRSHPSPLRNLELMLDNMLETQEDQLEAMVDRSEADAATLETARQVSRFAAKPTNRVEAKADQFKRMAKSKKKAEKSVDNGKDDVELKKVRRSRKGMRG